MANLFSDENFPQPVVERLRELGHDVETVVESGNAEQSWPDANVLDYATSNCRAVLTMNRRHFIRLHGERSDHEGIVVCTVDPNFERQAQRIHDALAQYGSLRGELIRVNRPAT